MDLKPVHYGFIMVFILLIGLMIFFQQNQLFNNLNLTIGNVSQDLSNFSANGTFWNRTVGDQVTYLKHANDSVGIGTTSPSEKLEVVGHINISGNTTNSSFTGDVIIQGTLYGGSPLEVGDDLTVFGDGLFNNIGIVEGNATGDWNIGGNVNISGNLTGAGSNNNLTLDCSLIIGGIDLDFCRDEGANGTQTLPIENVTNLPSALSCSGTDKVTNITINNSGVFIECQPDLDNDTIVFSLPLANITGIDSNSCTGTNKVTNVTFDSGTINITCSPDLDNDTIVFNLPLSNITGIDNNQCSGTDKVFNVSFNDGTLNITCSPDIDTIVTTLPIGNITNLVSSLQCPNGQHANNITINNSGVFLGCDDVPTFNLSGSGLPNQIAVWNETQSLSGTENLTFIGNILSIIGNITATITISANQFIENGISLIDKYVLQSTVVEAGTGLTGGGNLSTNITLNVNSSISDGSHFDDRFLPHTTTLPISNITGLISDACSANEFVDNVTFENGNLTVTCRNETSATPHTTSLPIANITNLISSQQCSGTDKVVNVTINNSGLFITCGTDLAEDGLWSNVSQFIFTTDFNASVGIGRIPNSTHRFQIFEEQFNITQNVTVFNESSSAIAFYRFEEGSGNNCSDSSGNNLHGTIFGATYASSKGGNGTGNFSLDFDGGNDYCRVPNDPILNIESHPISFTFWVNADEFDQNTRMIYKNVISTTTGYIVNIDGAGRVGVSFNPTSSSTIARETSSTLTELTWQHVGIVVNGTTTSDIHLFINAVKQGTQAFSASQVDGSDLDLYIAVEADLTNDYKGLMDEVAIYNRSITDSEMVDIYNNGVTINTTNTTSEQNVTIGMGNVFDVSDDGHIHVYGTGNLSIFEGNVQIKGTLFGGSPLKFDAGAYFADNVFIDGTVTADDFIVNKISAESLFTESINASNPSVFENNLQVIGNLSGGSPLKITGGLSLNGNASFNSDLLVEGTLRSEAIASTSTHALINYKDYEANILNTTNICVVADNNRVVLTYLHYNKSSSSYQWIFTEDSPICLKSVNSDGKDKEVFESVNKTKRK